MENKPPQLPFVDMAHYDVLISLGTVF